MSSEIRNMESRRWSFPFEKHWKLSSLRSNRGHKSAIHLCSTVRSVLIHFLYNHTILLPIFFTETGKFSKEILFANNLQMQSALTLFSKPTAHSVHIGFPPCDPPVALSVSSAIFSVLILLLRPIPSDKRKQSCTIRRTGRWSNRSIPSLTPMNSASDCLFCWFVCPL